MNQRFPNLTIERAIAYQQEQLAAWKTKLIPACFRDLKAYAEATNATVKRGDEVCRGDYLSGFVANWKPAKLTATEYANIKKALATVTNIPLG